MKSARTKLVPVALLVVLALGLSGETSIAEIGAPTDVVFGSSTVGTFRSDLNTPLRGTAQYSHIDSKWNQPRYLQSTGYSNPHRGVDQHTGVVLDVYPVTTGKIYSKGASSILVQLDFGGDGIYEPVWMAVYHLSKVTALPVGSLVNSSTMIGATQDNAAVDWRFYSDCNVSCRSLPAYPYMRNVAGDNWNRSGDLDSVIVKGIYLNQLYLTAYTVDAGSRVAWNASQLVVWYRKQGDPLWINGGNPTLISGYDFQKDLKAMSGFPTGTTIQVLVRGERLDENQPNYRWNWMPAKYNYPDPPTATHTTAPTPNEGGLSFDYLTVTLQ